MDGERLWVGKVVNRFPGTKHSWSVQHVPWVTMALFKPQGATNEEVEAQRSLAAALRLPIEYVAEPRFELRLQGSCS